MAPNNRNSSAERLTRRDLLKRSSAASLILGAVSSTGCLETLPPLGQRIRFGRVDVPPAASPGYRSWIPAPSALSDDHELDPDHVIHTTPGNTGQDVVGRSFTFASLTLKSQLDWFGHGFRHYDRAVMVDQGIVLEGRIDRPMVESTITDTGYDFTGTYESYDLYGRSDIRRTVAVDDDAILWSQGETSERTVEAMIDADDGRIDRYHETDGDFDAITTASGDRPFNWFGPTDMDPTGAAVAGSSSFAYDAESVYFVRHLLYPNEDAVPEQEIRRELAANKRAQDSRVVDVRSEGRLAIIEQRHRHETFLDTGSEHHWPQITWGIDHDEDAKLITIHHEAGEPIDTEPLTIRYWSRGEDAPAETQFADEYDVVRPGHSLTLDLSDRTSTDQVIVTYEPGERATSWLVNYSLP